MRHVLELDEGDRQAEEEMPAINQDQPKKPLATPPKPPPASREISVPVGVTEEGQIIFAHVRFDGPLSKPLLESLKTTLDSLGKNLPN